LITKVRNRSNLVVLALLGVLFGLAQQAHATGPDYAGAATAAAGEITGAITDMLPIILGVVGAFVAFGMAKKMIKKAS
jgi:uncharacterized membrane protein